MLVYKCSICRGCYNSKLEWLDHLIHKDHLNLARRVMHRWREGERGRVLVVFAKLPVGEDVKIIQKLSADGNTVVTDFVWWEERPRVGFVQFESREVLTKVMTCLADDRFELDGGQMGQVMDGGTIAEPEWLTLFPSNETDKNRAPTSPKQIKLELEDVDSEEEQAGFSSPTSLSFNASFVSNQDLGLRHHLSSIQKLIEIPDQEYERALDITRTFQHALFNIHLNGEPLIKVSLCRNWILKLQYSLNKQAENVGCALAIHCHRDPANPREFNMDELKARMEAFLHGREVSIHFPQYRVNEVGHDKSIGMGKRGRRTKKIRRYRFVSRNNPNQIFRMSLVFKNAYPVESQVYFLVKYLCTFDPHCYPVLSLAYYWARANSVTVGKSHKTGTSKDLGDPCTLTWLLIFFFQREGLIPPPKVVMDRPHEPIFYGGLDLGFCDSPEFATSWRRSRQGGGVDEGDAKFAGEVFTLLYKFFSFCDTQLAGATIKGKGWMLNTRDSELIPLAEMKAGPANVRNSKLTVFELTEIRKSFVKQEVNGMLVMLHPLVINWRISTMNVKLAFNAMKRTVLKMNQQYFDKDEGVKREKLELEEFLSLLKN